MKEYLDAANPEAEWFGYTRVSPDEKTKRVHGVFSSVAENYDLMNDLMSVGLHRLWKETFVSKMRPRSSETVLDVAGGTGDIALRCARAMSAKASTQAKNHCGHIYVCDINEDMMRVGKTKAIDEGWLSGIEWLAGSAEDLPIKAGSIDLACISFGLRNVTHIDRALREFARVLRPGGRFYCMEFSPGILPAFKKIYDLYSFSILPWLGEKVAKDRDSYQYLAESIRQFPSQEELSFRMKKAGFENVAYENLMGGVVAIHSGWIL